MPDPIPHTLGELLDALRRMGIKPQSYDLLGPFEARRHRCHERCPDRGWHRA